MALIAPQLAPADTAPACCNEVYAGDGRWVQCSHTADRTGEDLDGALVTYCECCTTSRCDHDRRRCSGAPEEDREAAREEPCYCRRPSRYCICP